MRPGEAYWKFIESYWSVVDIYNGGDIFLETFGQLPTPAGHLLALHWCRSEVCNGGFHQFFQNPTGVLAPEAVQGFHAVGLLATAAVVAKAMAGFGDPYPREQRQRHAFLAAMPGKTREEWDPFTVLDDVFYETIGKFDMATGISGNHLNEAADEYARKHSIPLTSRG